MSHVVSHEIFPDLNEERFELHLGQTPAGYATTIDCGHEIWIAELWVHPDYRRQGLAVVLLEAIFSRYPGRDLALAAEPFELSAQPEERSPPALSAGELAAWYSRHGFRRDGGDRMIRLPEPAEAVREQLGPDEPARRGAAGMLSSDPAGPRLRMAAASSLPELAFAGGPFDPGEAVPARQEPEPGRNKPAGGVWLSPVRRDASGRARGSAWTEWCAREGYSPQGARRAAVVTPVCLADAARVVVISGPDDYAVLAAVAGTRPGRSGALSPSVELDWERVAAVADAVWLTSEGLYHLGGWGEPFYWWDTESVIVLNPAALGLSGGLKSSRAAVNLLPAVPDRWAQGGEAGRSGSRLAKESPQTRAAHEGPWYHGTCLHFEPGDLVEPGHAPNFADEPEEHAYFTGTPEGGMQWAGDVAELEHRRRMYQGAPKPRRVYEVEPTGHYEPDPKREISGDRGDYRSRYPLRVVREFDQSRWCHRCESPHRDAYVVKAHGGRLEDMGWLGQKRSRIVARGSMHTSPRCTVPEMEDRSPARDELAQVLSRDFGSPMGEVAKASWAPQITEPPEMEM